MSTNEAAARLAKAVTARRADLQMSQLEVTATGGPSNTLQTEIENGRLENLTPRTARKIDDGLQWENGSAMAVWRGEDKPVPRALGVTASGDMWLSDNTQEIRALREYLAVAGADGVGVKPPAIALGLWDFEDLMQAAILKHRDERDLMQHFINILSSRPRQVSEPEARTDLALAADEQGEIAGEQESHNEP